MTEAVWVNIRVLWNDPRVKGLERLFDILLLLLRFLSLSYHLKRFLPEPDSPRRAVRSSVIDAYCILQLIVLMILMSVQFGPVVETVIAAYILFDIYLNLFNIIFIGKVRAINAPPASIERSILLLFVNVVQVALAFAVFYHHWLGLSGTEAFFNAVLVLGTIGYPTSATGWLRLLVSLQVLLDLVLLVLMLSSFVGQTTLFRAHAESGRAPAPDEPLQRPAPPAAERHVGRTAAPDMDAEQLSQLRQYAWNYFSVHADQRLKTFNFYAVLATAIVAGILAIAREAKNPAVAAPLAFLLAFLSFIFWKLDQRNRQLIKHGENALKYLEGQTGPSAGPVSPHILQLFRYEENATSALPRFPKTWPTRAHFSYSTCFNAVFFLFGFGGVRLR